VIVNFAPLSKDFLHPIAKAGNERNRRVKQFMETWSSMASAMSIWTYTGNRAHYLMPNPDLDALVPDIKFFVDNKATGIFVQGTHQGPGSEFVGLRMWVLARALWNPDSDGQTLIREFLQGYYGPAAPAIREYIDLIHDHVRKNEDFQLGRNYPMGQPFLHPRIVVEAEKVLHKADRAVAGDAALERRVRHAHMPLWYILAKRGPDSKTWQAVEAAVGKLDFAAIASNLDQVAKEYPVTCVSDPVKAQPFLQWLTDYATRLENGGRVVPPELAGKRMDAIRLVQAHQIDGLHLSRGQWQTMADASDGWVLRVIKPRWNVQHRFTSYDDYAAGKAYTLHVRVKGSEKMPEGTGLKVGLFGDSKLPEVKVPAETLADGRFHVVTLGPFTPGESLGLYLTTGGRRAPEVYFDCMWLQPVE
jgi:hypothetical protein